MNGAEEGDDGLKEETELTAKKIGGARLACEGGAQKQTDTGGKRRA